MDDPSTNPFADDFGYTPSSSSRPVSADTAAAPWSGSTPTSASGTDGADSFFAAPAAAKPAGKAAKGTKSADALPSLSAALDPKDGPAVAQLRNEVRALEQRVQERDATIAVLREQVAQLQQTSRAPNWPRFLPVTYINIKKEITDPTRQRHVRMVYIYWMFVMVCYISNFFFVASAYWAGALQMRPSQIRVDSNGYIPFMYQVIIILTAPPFSFMAWFKTLYSAARRPGPLPSSKYWLFFVNFFVHCVVCILCMAGVFFMNGGIVFASAFFEDVRRLDAWGYTFVTSAILWGLAAVLAIYILVTIGLWYRRNGGARPTTTDFVAAIPRAPAEESEETRPMTGSYSA